MAEELELARKWRAQACAEGKAEAESLTPNQRLDRARKLDQEIRELGRMSRKAQAEQAYKLAQMECSLGYRVLGLASIHEYAYLRFDWGRKKTETLLLLVWRLQKLPLIRDCSP